MKVINLLPKSRQKELRYESMIHAFVLISIFSLLSYALVFLVQFGLKFYLDFEAVSIKSEISQLQKQVDKKENAELKTKVSDVNALVSDYLTLAHASPNWARIIRAFAALPPEGVKIFSLNIDPNTKAVIINGLSPSREKVIELYNNLLNDKEEFSGVDYPLENVAQPTNNTFHFNFFVKDSLWKP